MIHDSGENTRLVSTVRSDGLVELRLQDCPVAPLGEGDVLVRVEASPINPSDIGMLLALADAETARVEGQARDRRLVATLPDFSLGAPTARFGVSLPTGNEGAGVVVDAAPEFRHLVGKPVALIGGAMYARYCTVAARKLVVLPDGTDPAEAAGLLINPLTALIMADTMRSEGHRALVHTAAASSLGQILNRLCLKDGVGLVNIVRNGAQMKLLEAQGAKYVVDSSSETFMSDLTEVLAQTGATLAFDAVGGGKLAGQILQAMEAAASRANAGIGRYGSGTHKQVYLHGSLDAAATVLERGFGLAWSVGGFQLTTALTKLGKERRKVMEQRIVSEMCTTFASHYGRTIEMSDMLDPEVIRAIARRATGQKFLLRPNG